MKIRIQSFLPVMWLLIMGCASTPMSPREAFLSSRTHEQKNYRDLYEVSLESLVERDTEAFRATRIAVRGAREASADCITNCPALEKRLARIETIASGLRDNRLAIYERVKRESNPKTDSLLYYHYQSESREAVGFLVMSGGKLKKDVVIDGEKASQP